MPRHKRGWAIKDREKSRFRRTPLTVALVEPALMILIRNQPRHGYALHAALKQLGIRPIHPSVVYRTLKQMEALEWIQSDWDTDSTQGPPRKMFWITEIGESALQTWQEELEQAQESIRQMLHLEERR